jgi:hypothetical protein
MPKSSAATVRCSTGDRLLLFLKVRLVIEEIFDLKAKSVPIATSGEMRANCLMISAIGTIQNDSGLPQGPAHLTLAG